MNRKGFTLIELLATIVLIAVVMGIVLPSAINVSDENKQRIYHEYEKMMEEYALVSDKKGQSQIELSDLEGLEEVKKNCTGYAYVTLVNTNPMKYEAHIQCGDYSS